MTSSTKIQWRVQTRRTRTASWKNAGLFETRTNARHAVELARAPDMFGWGNARVVRKGPK